DRTLERRVAELAAPGARHQGEEAAVRALHPGERAIAAEDPLPPRVHELDPGRNLRSIPPRFHLILLRSIRPDGEVLRQNCSFRCWRYRQKPAAAASLSSRGSAQDDRSRDLVHVLKMSEAFAVAR